MRWRRKWQPTPVFLPGEPHEQYEKAKRYEALDEKHKSEGVQHATGEERKAILIAPGRMKWLGQRKKHLIVDVSGGESKV